jgi:hypothetical protein
MVEQLAEGVNAHDLEAMVGHHSRPVAHRTATTLDDVLRRQPFAAPDISGGTPTRSRPRATPSFEPPAGGTG